MGSQLVCLLGLVCDSDSADRFAWARVVAAALTTVLLVAEIPAAALATLGLAGFLNRHVKVLNPMFAVPALIDVPDPPTPGALHPGWILRWLGNVSAAVTPVGVVPAFEGLILTIPWRFSVLPAPSSRPFVVQVPRSFAWIGFFYIILIFNFQVLDGKNRS